ncbi:MAG: YkgJ family cysteine cluster protein [Flammeovirgaceae bacterium]
MADLITDWKKRKGSVGKKHKKFIRKLAQHKGKHLNRLADETHDRVFAKIDCLACANCCTSIPPIVNKTDSTRIAKHLGMKQSEFEEHYLTVDEDHDTVMNQSPCPFLQADNRCEIYEVRPKACREYPHTNQQEFSQNLHLHAQNAMYCPAVFHILEAMERNVPV